jgi:osmotically-inducible protein OsmY
MEQSRCVAMIAGAMLIGVIGCATRQPTVARDDISITTDVRARLAANVQTNASELTVDTKAGVVRLTGAVATDDERNSIERIARDTPGVQGVDNNVRFGAAAATTP